jgi:hypothetical protein
MIRIMAALAGIRLAGRPRGGEVEEGVRSWDGGVGVVPGVGPGPENMVRVQEECGVILGQGIGQADANNSPSDEHASSFKGELLLAELGVYRGGAGSGTRDNNVQVPDGGGGGEVMDNVGGIAIRQADERCGQNLKSRVSGARDAGE